MKQRFPGGQLYVDLCGFDAGGVAMDPAAAIRGFLDALGVPRDRIPASTQAQASLYRSVLAGKRLLVVLDNARDEQQVRPLLPGGTGFMVVVTSRNQLPGLVAADGAHPVALDLPPVADARQILARRLGDRRVDAEPEAVDDIIARCARLPLALAVAAARAALAPTLSLAGLAAALHDAAAALDPFDGADPATNVRAVFSWSYRALGDPAARLFRLLGLCPGPDISVAAAASVAGLPVRRVRPLLAELVRAHLLTETIPGRFGFHELLRAYAVEQAHAYENAQQRAAVRLRFLDHQLHTAHAATLLLKPAQDPLDLAAPARGVVPVQPADRDAALTWFTAERAVLLTTVSREPDGFDHHTWQLAWTLLAFLTTRGHWRDNQLVQSAGLEAAQRLDDLHALGCAHRSLGKVFTGLGRLTEAQHHSQSALHLFERAGDHIAVTEVRLDLAGIAEHQGVIRQALTHAEHAYDVYKSIGHLSGRAYAANATGWYRSLLGDHATGLTYCQEALDIFIKLDDIEGAAATWDSLGRVYFGLNDPHQGQYCYQQAIDICHELGNRYCEAYAYANLVDGHHQADDQLAARRARHLALAVLDDLEPGAAAHIRARLDAVPLP